MTSQNQIKPAKSAIQHLYLGSLSLRFGALPTLIHGRMTIEKQHSRLILDASPEKATVALPAMNSKYFKNWNNLSASFCPQTANLPSFRWRLIITGDVPISPKLFHSCTHQGAFSKSIKQLIINLEGGKGSSGHGEQFFPELCSQTLTLLAD